MEIFGQTVLPGHGLVQVPGTFSPVADRCDAQVLVLSYHITSTSKRPACMAVDAGVSQAEYPSV